MNNLDLSKKFEEFCESRKCGISKVKKVRENGGTVAGTFCSFVPLEILDAAGVHTVSLCGMSDEPIVNAEADLPQNLCPLVKSSYGSAVSDKYNYTYFSDIIIGETTCDGKKKMYELLSELKDTYIMQLPQGIDRDYAASMWIKEVQLLIKTLEEKLGIEITEDKLREATAFRNNLRSLYGELFELGKLEPPAIKGYNMYKILEEYKFNFDLNKQYENLKTLIDQIKIAYEEGARPIDKNAKRILITGCPIGGVLDKIVKTIEDSNGVVVCFENCGGIKPIRNIIEEDTEDIVEAISNGYLNIGCSVMMPNLKRIEILPKLLEEFKIDGVIEIVLQTCHPYSVETRAIKELTNNLGIPYMPIETDYSEFNIGQIQTRISAFIEIL